MKPVVRVGQIWEDTDARDCVCVGCEDIYAALSPDTEEEETPESDALNMIRTMVNLIDRGFADQAAANGRLKIATLEGESSERRATRREDGRGDNPEGGTAPDKAEAQAAPRAARRMGTLVPESIQRPDGSMDLVEDNPSTPEASEDAGSGAIDAPNPNTPTEQVDARWHEVREVFGFIWDKAVEGEVADAFVNRTAYIKMATDRVVAILASHPTPSPEPGFVPNGHEQWVAYLSDQSAGGYADVLLPAKSVGSLVDALTEPVERDAEREETIVTAKAWVSDRQHPMTIGSVATDAEAVAIISALIRHTEALAARRPAGGAERLTRIEDAPVPRLSDEGRRELEAAEHARAEAWARVSDAAWMMGGDEQDHTQVDDDIALLAKSFGGSERTDLCGKHVGAGESCENRRPCPDHEVPPAPGGETEDVGLMLEEEFAKAYGPATLKGLNDLMWHHFCTGVRSRLARTPKTDTDPVAEAISAFRAEVSKGTYTFRSDWLACLKAMDRWNAARLTGGSA